MNSHQPPVMEPSAVPLVALESMNATHRQEVELVNRLGALLVEGADEAAIGRLLEEWVTHTREHFERENQLMRDGGFPAYPIHSDEHRKVLALIEELRRQWQGQRDRTALADFLFSQWPSWFHQHVNSMDRVTALFLSQRSA